MIPHFYLTHKKKKMNKRLLIIVITLFVLVVASATYLVIRNVNNNNIAVNQEIINNNEETNDIDKEEFESTFIGFEDEKEDDSTSNNNSNSSNNQSNNTSNNNNSSSSNNQSNNQKIKVEVPDTYLGYKENDFIKAIKALGLKPVKQDYTYEDVSYENGTVYSYNSSSDGKTFYEGDEVKYWLVDNTKAIINEEIPNEDNNSLEPGLTDNGDGSYSMPEIPLN